MREGSVLNGLHVLRLLIAMMLCAFPVIAAEDLVVVLSSDSIAYEKALEGFREEFQKPVRVFILSDGQPDIPADTRVVVAIGGKAALYTYPKKAALIYCLAPGILIRSDQHPGPRIKVQTSPRPSVWLPRLREIQPMVKRLAVFWLSDSVQNALQEGQKTAAELGIEIRSERLKRIEELPERLRAIRGQVDAMWLPPDPLIITPQTLAMLKEFSWSNRVPMYVPMESLVEKGAVAALSSNFKEIGSLSASLARHVQSGALAVDSAVEYPARVHVTLHQTAANQVGLKISEKVLQSAERIVP